MFAKQIDLEETDLKELIALVQQGAEILLTKGGTPFAKLSPVEQNDNPRIPDLFPGIWMSDDFDDPLPDEFWLGEE
jgi:antitoxin (DNA-binding transcriptional repressor) of toxin-antitoxin stability system